MEDTQAKPSKTVVPDGIYTLAEAAQYLMVSYNTLLRWIGAGTFPAFKLGRFWRVYGRDLLTLNEEGSM